MTTYVDGGQHKSFQHVKRGLGAVSQPEALALPLSYLHHFHRAPEGHRIRARPELYVEMDRLPKDAIDLKDALRKSAGVAKKSAGKKKAKSHR